MQSDLKYHNGKTLMHIPMSIQMDLLRVQSIMREIVRTFNILIKHMTGVLMHAERCAKIMKQRSW